MHHQSLDSRASLTSSDTLMERSASGGHTAAVAPSSNSISSRSRDGDRGASRSSVSTERELISSTSQTGAPQVADRHGNFSSGSSSQLVLAPSHKRELSLGNISGTTSRSERDGSLSSRPSTEPERTLGFSSHRSPLNSQGRHQRAISNSISVSSKASLLQGQLQDANPSTFSLAANHTNSSPNLNSSPRHDTIYAEAHRQIRDKHRASSLQSSTPPDTSMLIDASSYESNVSSHMDTTPLQSPQNVTSFSNLAEGRSPGTSPVHKGLSFTREDAEALNLDVRYDAVTDRDGTPIGTELPTTTTTTNGLMVSHSTTTGGWLPSLDTSSSWEGAMSDFVGGGFGDHIGTGSNFGNDSPSSSALMNNQHNQHNHSHSPSSLVSTSINTSSLSMDIDSSANLGSTSQSTLIMSQTLGPHGNESNSNTTIKSADSMWPMLNGHEIQSSDSGPNLPALEHQTVFTKANSHEKVLTVGAHKTDHFSDHIMGTSSDEGSGGIDHIMSDAPHEIFGHLANDSVSPKSFGPLADDIGMPSNGIEPPLDVWKIQGACCWSKTSYT